MERVDIKIFLVVILIIAIAVFVFLRGNSDGLPRGTTVLGFDVSGKSSDQAISFLKTKLQKESIILISQKSQSRGNIKRKPNFLLIRKKLQNIEKGHNFFARVGGKSAPRNINPPYQLDQEKLRALFLSFKKKSQKPPRQAQVYFDGKLRIKPGRIGWRLENKSWQKTLRKARRGDSLVALKKTPWRPKLLKRSDVWRNSPAILVVNKSAYTLSLYRKGKKKETYSIAVGQPGFETPSGAFRIANKAIDPAWNVPEWGGALAGTVVPGGSPENPLINRWLGIYDGVGIHGTREVYSLGSRASHGCIRMDPEEVISLYDKVPLNSRVIIF